jgi:hydrogenase 3 maturation protease
VKTSLKSRLEGCRRLALLGIGSELCADDGAGILLVRSLRSLICRQPFNSIAFEGFEGGNAPENATGFIAAFRPTHILMVDAAEIGAVAGEFREILPAEIPDTCFSTHTLPLKIIVDYLVGVTGAVVSVIGIQPANLDFGNVPSPEVRQGVRRLMRLLHNVMGECDRAAPRDPPAGSVSF